MDLLSTENQDNQKEKKTNFAFIKHKGAGKDLWRKK